MLRFLKKRGNINNNSAVEKTRDAWFAPLANLFQRSSLGNELWNELEELLIMADVGAGTTYILLEGVKKRIKVESVTSPGQALELLKDEMIAIVTPDPESEAEDFEEYPLVILVVGVNGAGKTTSIAKLASLYQNAGKTVILGAADTFRAAAIDQLQTWGQQLGVVVIAHKPGADPGAVAFDTLQAATARGADVTIIDTAGRLHTKTNLMEEIKKVQRVLSRQGPNVSQRVLLTLDATTGQNGLLQARSFVEVLRCDGVFLAKLDGTAKGGMILPIANELKLPVLYIGTGEGLADITAFDPTDFIEALFGPRMNT